MRSIFASAGLALALVGFAAQQANASPITYEFSGTGSGAIGGTSFTDALVVFTGTADTANRRASGGGLERSVIGGACAQRNRARQDYGDHGFSHNSSP